MQLITRYFPKKMNRKSYYFLLILMLLTLMRLLLVSLDDNSMFFNLADRQYILRDKSLKYVQLYTSRFGEKYWALPGLGEEAFKNCAEKRCYAFEYSLAQIAVENADAVVVHGPNLVKMPNRRKYKRNRKQLWMYYSMESPRLSYKYMFSKPAHLDDWFNLTATYKQNSNYVTDYRTGFQKWSDIKIDPE